jgi:NAD(P)-dependent dehydrogenase (short-subunit alcohol dehydrogenase family)
MTMAGRIVLVTGATSGIGLETARGLAARGAHVVLGVRDAARGEDVARRIAAEGGTAEVLPLDLDSFASVRSAAERFAAGHERLDVLVNNAGTALRKREISSDGHERTWQTNYLAQVLLTRLLLPLLRRGSKPRIVNVGSDAHRTGRIDWDDLELARRYNGYRAYANTKVALALFTRELARREPGIAVNVVHPGAIATRIWRSVGWLQWLMDRILPGPPRGAAPVVRLASDPALDGVTGRYFSRFREATLSASARNDADAARLWDLATRQLGTI